jgi:ADP-heptose:LPS heptosyltransferase
MLEKLRLDLGTSYARFHFRSMRDPIVRFTQAVSTARRLVVIMPEIATEAAGTDIVLKFLGRAYHTSRITLVARQDVVPALPDHRGFNLVTFTEEELSMWYLPRPELLRKVKKSTFDVALDLNVRFALPSSFLCRASQAPLRIGFVKPYADSFYNFQVQTGQSNNLAQIYSQLLKCIDMF